MLYYQGKASYFKKRCLSLSFSQFHLSFPTFLRLISSFFTTFYNLFIKKAQLADKTICIGESSFITSGCVALMMFIAWLWQRRLGNQTPLFVPIPKSLRSFFLLRIFSNITATLAWQFTLKNFALCYCAGFKLLKPVIVMLTGLVLLKEMMTLYRLIGLIFMLFGGYLCCSSHFFHEGGNFPLYAIFAPVLSVVALSSCEFTHKKLVEKLSINSINFMLFGFGTLFYGIFWIFTPGATLPNGDGLFYLTLAGISWGIATFAVSYSLRKIDLIVSGLIGFSGYMWNVFNAWCFLGERPEGEAIFGAILIISTNIFLTYKEGQQRKNHTHKNTLDIYDLPKIIPEKEII